MAETGECPDAFKVPENIDKCDSGNIKKDVKTIESAKSSKSLRVGVPLPYKEPEWSGSPPPNYSFEIIKNGTSAGEVKIETSLVIFGRLDVCNVVFEHPSVSRYHAVIQYCKGDELHPSGFYLYDLNSTHGTFLNKEKVKPNIYYKLKAGYVLKFGGSTRLHIFQGPEESEETEIKVLSNDAEDNVCTWGMTEDADEEEDLTENPYAVSTPNEDLYLDDPKKTLRGWFEREGYELEYDVEEKGFKSFVCRVKLPVDNSAGDFMPVEATVSGKKKEAVVACALEACRTLDRLGLLRQSHHESRQRKKKKWEDDDYYDSDEDTFLDRTGTIEKKREMRKRMEKKVEVETFESLEAKYKAISEEISDIKKKLSTEGKHSESEERDEGDTLEMYMSSLADSDKTLNDKIERSKLKFRLSKAEKEKNRLEKLLDIAKPAKLPPVVKYPGMIGKKLKAKLKLSDESNKGATKQNEKLIAKSDENIEEVDSDVESEVKEDVISNHEASKFIDIDPEESKSGAYGLITKNQFNKNSDVIENKKFEEAVKNISEGVSKRSIGPSLPEDIKMKNVNEPKDVSSSKRRKRDRSKKTYDSDPYLTGSSEYSTWTPPPNQTGDGMTYLNEKFGY